MVVSAESQFILPVPCNRADAMSCVLVSQGI